MSFLSGDLSFASVANFFIAAALIIGAMLSVIFMIKGGISFILASGDEEKIKAAVHTIRYAIVGLIVIFVAVLIIRIVGAIFGFNFLSFLTVEEISNMTNIILKRLQSTPSEGGMTGVLDN